MKFEMGDYVRNCVVVITLLYSAALNAQVTSNSPVCEGAAINLTVSATGSGYYWTGPNGFFSFSRSPVISPATLADGGDYQVGVINSANDTTFYSATVTVLVDPPNPQLNAPYTACAGKSFTLFALDYDPSFDYTWTGPGGFGSNLDSLYLANVTTANQGTYTVIAKNGICSSSTVSFTIRVNAKPTTPIISSAATFCEDGTINLTSSNGGPFAHSWSGPDNFNSNSNSPVINNADRDNEGSYSLIFLDGAGCQSDVTSKSITMTPAPAAASITGDTTLCTGDSLLLTANTIGAASQYTWTTPGNPGFAKTYKIVSVNTSHTGVYGIRYFDGKCFSRDTSVNVVVNNPPVAPTASANAMVLCELDTLILSTQAVPGENYRWGGPTAYTATTDIATRGGIKLADSGTYYVQAIVNGCFSDTGFVTISIKPTPIVPALFTNAPVCAKLPLDISLTPESGITYTWQTPDGTIIIDSTIAIPISAYADSGYYRINASVNGCTSPTDSIHIRIKHRIDPFGPYVNTPVCVNYHLDLVMGVYEEAVYSWTGPKSTVPLTTDREYYGIAKAQLSDAGKYTGTAMNTCDTVRFDTVVIVLKSPEFTIVGDTGICDYETRVLKVDMDPAGQDLTYIWNTFETTDEITIDTNSLYFNVATNQNGCTTRVEHEVYYICRPEVYVPNAFTPNGDGINDRFEVNLHNVYEYKLEIFARNGDKVFESIDPNKYWDGSFGPAGILNTGQYIYTLKFKTNYHYVIYEEFQTGQFFLLK